MYGGKNSAGPRLKLARVVVWYLQYKYCDKTKMTNTNSKRSAIHSIALKYYYAL